MSIELINTTRYGAFGFTHVLLKQRPYYIVVTKQSWHMMPGGGLRLLDEARPVRIGDRFAGRPDFSAITLPTDIVPYKPHGEIIVCGSARRADAQATWEVELAVPAAGWSKVLSVFGPRTWQRGLMGWKLSTPQPAQQVRLDYGGAYGGHFELPPPAPEGEPLVVCHAPNPGGTGWLGAGHGHKLTKDQARALKERAAVQTVAAPCLEQPAWLSQQRAPGNDMKPLAFGALPAWSPQRLACLKGMKPPPPEQSGYPDDFNMDHWQQATSDQWLPKEALPGAALLLRGVFEEGDAVYRVPKPQTLCYVRSRTALNAVLNSDIDTLVIDADARVLEVIERRLISLEEFGQDAVVELMQRAG